MVSLVATSADRLVPQAEAKRLSLRDRIEIFGIERVLDVGVL